MNRWTLGVALFFLGLAAGDVDAQTRLAYRFKAGDKLDYEMDQKMKMVMTVNGMDIDMKIDQLIEKKWEVQKVDEKGTARVRVRFGRVKLGIEGFTGIIEVDSADDKELKDPMGMVLSQVVKALAAIDASLTIDPTGKVSDVTFAEGAFKRLKEIKGLDTGGLSDLTSEAGLKAMMEGGMVFPGGEFAKGRSWSQKQDIEMPFGKLRTDTKYTYEGSVERDGRRLEEIALKPETKLEPKADAPLQIKMKAGESKGKILFDNRLGRLIEQTTEATMEMSVEVGGMTINQNITQSIVVRLKNGKK